MLSQVPKNTFSSSDEPLAPCCYTVKNQDGILNRQKITLNGRNQRKKAIFSSNFLHEILKMDVE